MTELAGLTEREALAELDPLAPEAVVRLPPGGPAWLAEWTELDPLALDPLALAASA